MGGHHLKNFQPHCILQPAAGWRGNKSWPFATALIGRFRLYALHAVKSKKSQWTRKTSHACFSRLFFLRPCCPFRLPSSISLPILFFPLLFLNLFIFFGWVMCTSQDQREHIRACLDGRRCVVDSWSSIMPANYYTADCLAKYQRDAHTYVYIQIMQQLIDDGQFR